MEEKKPPVPRPQADIFNNDRDIVLMHARSLAQTATDSMLRSARDQAQQEHDDELFRIYQTSLNERAEKRERGSNDRGSTATGNTGPGAS